MGKPGEPGRRKKKRAKKVQKPVGGVGPGPAGVGDGGDSGGDDDAGDLGGAGLRAEDFKGKGDAGVVEVVEWVFEHLDLDDTKPVDAPSAGAWSQLLWGREHRKEFMALWGRTCASAKRVAAEGGQRDDGEELFELLDKLAAVRGLALDRAAERIVGGQGG